MHHYWVKEAGDPEAIGEYFPYFPYGDERDGIPIYRSGQEMTIPSYFSGYVADIVAHIPRYGVYLGS